MRHIWRFFDRFEDKIRRFLSRSPIIYAFIGGVGIVSFWRGVWETSDLLHIAPQASLIGGLIIMLSIGILVTEFLGNRIIISGLRGEKKLEEKTLDEIEEEEMSLAKLHKQVDAIEKMVKSLHDRK